MKTITISDEAFYTLMGWGEDVVLASEKAYEKAKETPPEEEDMPWLHLMGKTVENMRKHYDEILAANGTHQVVPFLVSEGYPKKEIKEIAKMAFDLIPGANRLIEGKSEDSYRDAMDIQKGLHAIEFKAERLSEKIHMPNAIGHAPGEKGSANE